MGNWGEQLEEVNGTGLRGNCWKDHPGIHASGPGAGGGNPEQESRLGSAEGPKQNPWEMPTWKPGSSPQRMWLPGLNRSLPSSRPLPLHSPSRRSIPVLRPVTAITQAGTFVQVPGETTLPSYSKLPVTAHSESGLGFGGGRGCRTVDSHTGRSPQWRKAGD